MDGFFHRSILLKEAVGGLAVRPDGVYVDGTLGGGGHTLEIAKRLINGGKVIGIDRDEEAIRAASERLADFSDRFIAVKSNFAEIPSVLQGLGIDKVDGILFDFGVSSPQLDHAERGFSYQNDAPLDMRMDREEGLDARTIVNTWDEEELRRIFFTYGEERYAGRIAAAIVRRREKAPIETTGELAAIVASAQPAKARREDQHPAKRVFQAVRIAVNGELDAIEAAIPGAVRCLRAGGRLAAISFHSLEDRIVKTELNRLAKGCTCPPDFPVCVCGGKPEIKWITKKPIQAGSEELTENPRARSAKLRVAEKL